MKSNAKSVATVLANYQDALNQSDTAAVMQLYAPDGVFMPQHFPSSIGADAVRRAYETIFSAITLNVTFEIAEIHEIAPDWAIARTNSAGTVKVQATGDSGPEGNQDLFVFQKIDAAWKIARYCFCITNPPRP